MDPHSKDLNAFILNEFEISTLKILQNFRSDPESYNKTRKGIILFLKKSKKLKAVDELEHIELKDFYWKDEYILSSKLCLAASKLLKLKNDKSPEVSANKVVGGFLQVEVNDVSMFYEEEGEDNFLISRFLVNDNDPKAEFRQLLKCKSKKYIGISQTSEENKLILFSQTAEQTAFLSINRYLDMLSSFKLFDYKHQNFLSVEKTMKHMKSSSYYFNHPLIYQMFIRLGKEKCLNITFLEYCNETHKYIEYDRQVDLLYEQINDYFHLGNPSYEDLKVKVEVFNSFYQAKAKENKESKFKIIKRIIDEHPQSILNFKQCCDYFLQPLITP